MRMGCPVPIQLLLLLLLLLFQLPRHLGQVSLSLPPGSTVSLLLTSPLPPTEEAEDSVPPNTTSSPSMATSTGGELEEEEEEEEEVVEEEEDWSPAEAYLNTGDAATLASSACPRSYRLPPQRGGLPLDLGPLMRPVTTSLANTANFLNLIFQASELREISIREDLEWYHALVRSLLEGDRPGLVRRALLTFGTDPLALRPQLVLRASRGPQSFRRRGLSFFSSSSPPGTLPREILLQDFTSAWESLHPPPPAPDDSWFMALKFAAPQQILAALSKRSLVNDLLTLETPKWARGDSYVTNSSGVRWADAPFLECEDGRFLPGWLMTLTMPFYGLKPDLSPEFRGVIRVDVNIQGYDIDQCAVGDVWFADTHVCNRTSMVCEPIPGQGFRLGQYCCRCKEGYYSPTQAKQGTVPGGGGANGTRACYPSMPICLPCWPGCPRCDDGSPCWVQEDWLLRAAVLTVQGLFMLLVFLSMLVTYQNRGTKRIRASGLLLLETILFGSLLLYFPVFILFFRPSTFRCILLRWVRLLGFAIVYGTMTLKMYRVLKVFLSRTAQRVPYMSSTSLLRMLGVMVATVSWFLFAWTAGVLQNRDRNVPLLVTAITSDGQGFSQCDIDRWDYMMALAERLFLCWGLFLCSAVKPVPSAFHEPRYMSIAIHNEMFLSCMFHLLHFSHPSLHPDWTLLLEFTHTHATITVTLALLFAPKFLHVSHPGREVIAAEVYEDEVDLRRNYLNSSFTSAWSDHSVEPEDIRDELKKLYSQLEIAKNKKMANSNPHIPKKQGSRFGIGRSIMKRIADFPETLSRQHSREDRGASRSRSPSLFSSASRKPTEITYVNYKEEYPADTSPNLPAISQSIYDYAHSRTPSRTPSIAGSLTPILVDKRFSQFSQHSQHSQYSEYSQHSQQSQTESIEASPMVCKSASAQNLSINRNFLHPGDSRRQKSLSAVVTNTDYYSMGEAAQSGATTPELKHAGSIKEQTTNALLAQSFDKTDVCPWEIEAERRPSKKHVTISISQNEGDEPPEKSPPLIICPWDNVDTLPSATKQKSIDSVDSDSDSVRLKAPISSSAPVSPSAHGKPKELRVFSFRSATKGLMAAKGIIPEKGKLTATLSVEVPKKTPLLQRRSMTTIQGRHGLVKQNAIKRLSSTDSAERSPYRQANPEVLVCPWESEVELTPQCSFEREGSGTDGMARPMMLTVPARQRSIKADVCPWEEADPQDGSATAAVCPWDAPDAAVPQVTQGSLKSNTGVPQPAERVIYVNNARGKPESSRAPKRQDTVPTEVRPWDSVESAQKQDGPRANVCPWESGEPEDTGDKKSGPSVTAVKKSPQLTKQVTISAEACPWEFTEQPDLVQINICPWETDSPKPPLSKQAAVVHSSQESIDKEKQPKGTPKLQQQDSVHANVCPWETEESPTPKDGEGTKCPVPVKAVPKVSPTLSRQTTTSAEKCPWDFSEPPPTANVCPWETEESPTPKDGEGTKCSVPVKAVPKVSPTLSRQTTTSAEKCPWDFSEPPPTANVCPWETEESPTPKDGEGTKCPVPVKAVPKVSPTLSRQTTTSAEKCPWDFSEPPPTANVCPWETEESPTPKDGEGTKCPVPVKAVPKVSPTLSRQTTTSAEKCPWDFSEPPPTANVCPWETEESPTPKDGEGTKCPVTVKAVPKVSPTLSRHTTTSAEKCPWDFPEPPPTANVCPWEAESVERQPTQTKQATRTISRQGSNSSKASVKPFEKHDSVKGNVCPWESQEPEGSVQPDEKANVCPWETESPTKTLQKQESTRAEACPWETESPTKILQKQDSTRTNVCPWETGGTEEANADDSTGATGTCPSKEITEDNVVTAAEQRNVQSPTESSEDQDVGRINSPLERRDALCPWAMERTEHDDNSDVFTWEENIPEEDEDLDAECAAEAFVFPSDLG